MFAMGLRLWRLKLDLDALRPARRCALGFSGLLDFTGPKLGDMLLMTMPDGGSRAHRHRRGRAPARCPMCYIGGLATFPCQSAAGFLRYAWQRACPAIPVANLQTTSCSWLCSLTSATKTKAGWQMLEDCRASPSHPVRDRRQH
ncbi:hypothetical protein AK812_SmicGene25733 [Symbiodinium microadriaticum]|uniref:Uncharacterized protein n=1 Tax=Symbiodinium microadriaticum TaxID=2951 RepID=A0A1Q9DB87_SYMMI|nr:hypothetical protein AK812_SmicGene25733 [Symbiodinium microadriaticum]